MTYGNHLPKITQCEHRITGWDEDNPIEVEIAFREGFLRAALEAIDLPVYEIKALYQTMMENRDLLYHCRKWDDLKAAFFRGQSHGYWYLFYHLGKNGGSWQECWDWLIEVEQWANEHPPHMENQNAFPPELWDRKSVQDKGE
jgi:hypothetical protein